MIISQEQQYDQQQNSERIDSQFNNQNTIIFRRQQSIIQNGLNNVWKTNGFNIIIIVLKFIQTITQTTFTTSFRILNRSFFKLIKDSAADYNYYRFRGYFSRDKPNSYVVKLDQKVNFLQYYRRNYIKRIIQFFLLEPDDTIIIIWNIYLLIIVTINVFYVSLRLSFIEIKEMSWGAKDFIFEQLPSYSFLFEILIKFNTCIYSKGVLIKNRKKLIKRYLKGEFIIDMVLIIPFFIGRQFDVIYLDLVIILKVFQISKLTNSLFNRLELTPEQTTIFELIKLIFFILMCAHFSACIWHKLGVWGDWGDENTITWLKKQLLYDALWIDRYVVSFYRSIVTMTTIGYGDITPVNLTERLFCIIMTLISTATFAYSVNSIGQIFQEISKQSVQFKTNMNSLNKFLKNQKVSAALQIKFRRYFEYFWSKPSQEVIQFQDQIPQQLKDQMTVDINIKLLKQLDLFKSFSNPLLNQLCLEFQIIQLQPDEYLYHQNQKANSLYILISGQIDVHVIINRRKRILEKVKSSQLIGQLDFFLNNKYRNEAIASKNTKLLSIDRDAFIQIIQNSEKDYEVYKKIEFDITILKCYEAIQIKCSICGKNSHYILDCPFLIGGLNKRKVLYQHRHNLPSDRKWISRNNDDRRISTKKHHFLVMESAIQYIMKNEDSCNIEGIKEQLQEAILKQQQQEQYYIQTNQNNHQLVSTQQNAYSNNSQQFLNPSQLKIDNSFSNKIISMSNNRNIPVPFENELDLKPLSKSQDAKLITNLNTIKIKPILEEPQTKEERSDEIKQSLNFSEQLVQIEKQQTTVNQDTIVQNIENKTEENEKFFQKQHTIKQQFQRKQSQQLSMIQYQAKKLQRLFSQRTDSFERLPKFPGYINTHLINSVHKNSEEKINNNPSSLSIQENIISNKQLSQPNKVQFEESPLDLNYSQSQDSIKNFPQPNLDIYINKIDEKHSKQQSIFNTQNQNQQIKQENGKRQVQKQENLDSENELTNQFLDEQIQKNKQRFSINQQQMQNQDLQQQNQNNYINHVPHIELKPIEQSMMFHYEKIRLKEEQNMREKKLTICEKQNTQRSLTQQKLERGYSIKFNSDDSSDEDINGQKLIRGQYPEIFKDFEVLKEYLYFYPKNNLSQIIFELNRKDFNSQHIFQRKKKIKKQDTIINLLKQTHLIRKSQLQ